MPTTDQATNRRRMVIGLGAAMLAVELIAVSLGVYANERWRWDYPNHGHRVPFERTTALSWLRTVIRSDFRKYDGADVSRLLDFVIGQKLLIGKAKAEIVDLLGPPFAVSEPPSSSAPDVGESCYYEMGEIPEGWRAHPLELRFTYDDRSICKSLLVQEPPN